MSEQDNAIDARGIAEDVMQQETAAAEAAAAPEAKPEAAKPEVKPEEKKPEAEAKPEAKTEEVAPEAEQKPKPSRESKFVPVQKFNQTRHDLQAAKARIAELEAAKPAPAPEATKVEPTADVKALAKEIAGEDASPEVVERILNALPKLAPKPAPESEDTKRVLDLANRMEAEANDRAFQTEMDKTLLRFPELKDHASALKELAFAEGNGQVPLHLLAYQLRDELNLSPAPPSGEGRAATAQEAPKKDYDALTAEEIESLPADEMDKFLDAKNAGIRNRTGLRN